MKVLILLCLLFFPLHVQAQGQFRLSTRLINENSVYSTASQVERTNFKIAIKSHKSTPEGSFRILIYAFNNDPLASDGNPDYNAYDAKHLTVSCPNSIPGVFEFGTPIIETAAIANHQYYNGYYHLITCPYTGTGHYSLADFGYTNDNYLQIFDIINPLHDPTLPNARLVYAPVWIQQIAQSGDIIYSHLETVTSSRSVQMLATISPYITFTLIGLPENDIFCNLPNQRPTTSALASFGIVNNLNFTDIAQRLIASTNIPSGFSITAITADQMSLIGLGSPVLCLGDGSSNNACIPSARVPGMSKDQEIAWTSSGQGKGLAFTLENVIGNDNVFNYHQGYRHFADAENGDLPTIIISSPPNSFTSTNNVCYRLVATNTNVNGTYEAPLTYTLTAKF